jgi:hypothetical protein
MGRIREDILVDGRNCWTLFDSGARYSYIARQAATGLDVRHLPAERSTSLGGRVHKVTDVCLVFADVAGHPLEFQASVIDEIGVDEDGKQIEVLFGAIAMQLWGIRLDLQNELLDFSQYTTDFVEF